MEMAQLFSPNVSSALLSPPVSSPESGADFRAQLQASLQAAQASAPPEHILPDLPLATPELPVSAEEALPPDPPEEALEITVEASEPEAPVPVLIWEDFYRLQQPADAAPSAETAAAVPAAPEGITPSAAVSPSPQPADMPDMVAVPQASEALPVQGAPETSAEPPHEEASQPVSQPLLGASSDSVAVSQPVKTASFNEQPSPTPRISSGPPPEAGPVVQTPADPENPSLPAPPLPVLASSELGVPVKTPPFAELRTNPVLLRPGDTFERSLQAEADAKVPLGALPLHPENVPEVPESFQLLENSPPPVAVPGRDPVAVATPRSAHAELIQRFELVQQLSRHVEMTRLQQGVQRAELQLEPAHLGKLQLQLQQSAQQVSLQIVTELPLAKELIEASLGQLRQHLAQQGLQLQQVQIHVQSDLGSQAGFQQSSDQPSSQSSSPQRRSTEAFDLFSPSSQSEMPITSPETVLQAVNTLV